MSEATATPSASASPNVEAQAVVETPSKSTTKNAKSSTSTSKSTRKSTTKNAKSSTTKNAKSSTSKSTNAKSSTRKRNVDAPKVAPHVDTNAVVIRERSVRNARVIVVKDAMYRGCKINGTFELADGAEVKLWRSGDARVKVDFSWFDWAPRGGAPSIVVTEGKYTIREKYTGKVVASLGRAAQAA